MGVCFLVAAGETPAPLGRVAFPHPGASHQYEMKKHIFDKY